jgi:hypothetical protein
MSTGLKSSIKVCKNHAEAGKLPHYNKKGTCVVCDIEAETEAMDQVVVLLLDTIRDACRKLVRARIK